MITTDDLSREIFATDMLAALKSCLKHHRKHVLRWLRLYGDQALDMLKCFDTRKKILETGSEAESSPSALSDLDENVRKTK